MTNAFFLPSVFLRVPAFTDLDFVASFALVM